MGIGIPRFKQKKAPVGNRLTGFSNQVSTTVVLDSGFHSVARGAPKARETCAPRSPTVCTFGVGKRYEPCCMIVAV